MSIRRQPEDFRVRERLRPGVLESLHAPPGDGWRWAVMSLEKTSLTTPDAAALLGKALGVPSAKVEHAGLKD
ncbi:MAG: tRNA pseudouridine(13) synthase TruD, partial [Phycisphaerales bacterium]|nr:tRNA pseudouridine(13) synthase TruD [Phycisphaerales bacterium]